MSMMFSRKLLQPARCIVMHKTTTTKVPSVRKMSTIVVPEPTYRSEWKRTTDVPLTRESFLDVLYGKTPTIREAGFFSPEACWKYEKELSPQLTPYKYNTGPTHMNVGVAQFEYQAQTMQDLGKRSDEKNQYFQEVKKWRNLHSDLEKKTGVNAWLQIFGKIASLVPEWDCEIANEGPDNQYFSGVFRALSHAAPIHCDWAPHDTSTEDWIINQVAHQGVFNLYLAPVSGGLSTVYDVQWTEDALKFRNPDGYDYSPAIVHGKQKAYIHPTPGSLVFFNTRNMHEVDKMELKPMPELGLPYRPRLTLSSFMGLIPGEKTGGKPKLIFWS